MPPIRILVVDDSVVIRKVLCDALAGDPAVEVAGTASDGRLALAKIGQLKPDILTLDVEMPNMSGLETIKEIRKSHPKLPIIMFSTLTERGATTTLDALALGASDYVTKPSNTGSLDVTMLRIKEDLLPKSKRCAAIGFGDKKPSFPPPKPPQPVAVAERAKARIEILAIGTSTGGPNALAEVIPAIPADFPVPIVIVQHMPQTLHPPARRAPRQSLRHLRPRRRARQKNRAGPRLDRSRRLPHGTRAPRRRRASRHEPERSRKFLPPRS